MLIQIELTDRELVDMLLTARCGYWACTDGVLESVANGESIVFHDREDGSLLGTLTYEVAKRLRLQADVPGVKAVLRAASDGYFDADSADVWVQLALFGEVRYG